MSSTLKEERERDSVVRTGSPDVYDQIAGRMFDYSDPRQPVGEKPRLNVGALSKFHSYMNEWLDKGAGHQRYGDTEGMMRELHRKISLPYPHVVYLLADSLRNQIDRWVVERRTEQEAGGGNPQDAGRNAPPDQNAPPPPRR